VPVARLFEVISVVGRGRELDARARPGGDRREALDDPYDRRVRWLKIKNPAYSQKEGRGDLFNRSQRGRAFGRLVVAVKGLVPVSESRLATEAV
jgi:hypothetical protein